MLISFRYCFIQDLINSDDVTGRIVTYDDDGTDAHLDRNTSPESESESEVYEVVVLSSDGNFMYSKYSNSNLMFDNMYSGVKRFFSFVDLTDNDCSNDISVNQAKANEKQTFREEEIDYDSDEDDTEFGKKSKNATHRF